MKKYIYKILPLLFLTMLVSCEEVVELELNSVEPRLVIDASISDNELCMVNLIKTQDFGDSTPFERVSGAVITLTDDEGNTETLIERSTGRYFSLSRGVIDQRYTLKVTVEGQSYEASATIPGTVPIDSMYIYSIQIGTETWLSPTIIYDDPKGIPNYYYSTITLNGQPLRTIYLDTDEYNDGVLAVQNILFYNKEDNRNRELQINDTIKANMQSIDQGAYTYFSTLFSVAAGGGTNPISNFSNKVLGCFKAYNDSSREIIISEDNIIRR